jgi:hypothetical protein
MLLTFGRKRIKVTSLEEASRIYSAARDNSGKGASGWPAGKVDDFHISYNGKVWSADRSKVIFDPFA